MREVKKRKQKLQGKFKNTPSHTSLVACTVSPLLNRDQSLSVKGKVRTCNNLEVNLRQPTGGLKDRLLVYVRSVDGKPLMPCTPTKARHLLKAGRARVVGCYPFRIQLLFECENKVQDVTLGVDTGYEHVGFSAVSSKSELLCGEMKLENGMSKRLIEKQMYRRGRRNKLWYRQPRFDNRRNMEGRMPPSVERRIQSHVGLVQRICGLLPISRVNIETANFDIQKIENPNIKNKGYQQGNLYDYENKKAYVIAREQGKCQLCGKEYDDNGWHLHHVLPRGQVGSDRPANMALLHEKCHDKLHQQKLFHKLKAPKQFKAETFMSTARKRILEGVRHPNVHEAYGYETKVRRIEQQLPKSHINDAFVIAMGVGQGRAMHLSLTQKKHNNRCIQTNRKGYRPSIRRQRSTIQPNDLFWVDGKKYTSRGMFSYGKYILYGDANQGEYVKTESVESFFSNNTWQFNPHLKEGVFLPRQG